MTKNNEPVIYKTVNSFSNNRSSILVIHCSDNRYQDGCDELLKNHFHHDSFYRIAIPGGAQILSMGNFYPKFEWGAKKLIHFLVDHAGVKQIILIGHADCAWYTWFKNVFCKDKNLSLKEYVMQDSMEHRKYLKKIFGNINIYTYYAEPNSNGTLDFIEI